MRDRYLLVLLILLFSIQSSACQDNGEYSRKEAGAKGEAEYVANELLVMFREGVAESRMNAINETLNVQIMKKMPSGRIHLIKVPRERSLEEVRQAYLSFPEVQAVDFNYKIQGM